MFSLSIIMIPVLLETNSTADGLVRQWKRLYHYGHICMPTMAVSVTGLYGFAAARCFSSGSANWKSNAAAGALTIGIVPFTLLVMAPTNDALFATRAPILSPAHALENLAEVQRLIMKWVWLHAVRSVFPLVGAVVGSRDVLRGLA